MFLGFFRYLAFWLVLELHFIKLLVTSSLNQEFLMCALFNYLTIFHNAYPVGIPDCG